VIRRLKVQHGRKNGWKGTGVSEVLVRGWKAATEAERAFAALKRQYIEEGIEFKMPGWWPTEHAPSSEEARIKAERHFLRTAVRQLPAE
jgi:hypothetical protein